MSIFQFDITSCFCYVVDDGNRYDYVANAANFWEHGRIRSTWFDLIHLHWSKINQSDMGI